MTLVIPDIHEPSAEVIQRIETLISLTNPDRTVFLGDYFDRFEDTPEDARRTADWLLKSISGPKRIHLIGNHDLAYLWPGPATACLGYTDEKCRVIREALGPSAATRFMFHHFVGGWLLSQAGLASCWLPDRIHSSDLVSWLEAEDQRARNAFSYGSHHWFAAIGQRYGGNSPAGGLTWCHWRELEIFRITGLQQLVGHTPGTVERWHGKTQLCIDANLGHGPTLYALISGGAVTVLRF